MLGVKPLIVYENLRLGIFCAKIPVMTERRKNTDVISWSRKDLGQNPDQLKLRGEVLGRIKGCLSVAGLEAKSARLRLHDIFIPKIFKTPRAVDALEKFGLSKDLSHKCVILIENGRDKLVDDYITISTDKEGLEGENDDTMWIQLKNLFFVSRRVSDVVLQYQEGRFPCIFERQGVEKGKLYIGEFTDDEEYVLLIADEWDGVAKTFSLRLPKKWRDAVEENGRLIDGIEEKQVKSELKVQTATPDFRDPILRRIEKIKEQAETPELKLQNEVIENIRKHLEDLGLKFNPEDISVPSVSIGYDIEESRIRTQDALNRAELPAGFSVICVGEEKEKSIVIVGRTGILGTNFVLGTSGSIIARLQYDSGRNPSKFKDDDTKQEIRLGRDLSLTENYVLFVLKKNNGKYQVSSLTLPDGWMSISDKDKDGRLIGKPIEVIKQAEQEETVEKTAPTLSPEEQVFLETPKKESYSQKQLEEMRRTQWKEYDDMKGITHVHKGADRSGAGGNYAKGSVQTGNVEKLFKDETLFPRNALPSSHTGNPPPSFKDRPDDERKKESQDYWKHKAEKRNKKSKNSGKSKKGK